MRDRPTSGRQQTPPMVVWNYNKASSRIFEAKVDELQHDSQRGAFEVGGTTLLLPSAPLKGRCDRHIATGDLNLINGCQLEYKRHVPRYVSR
jgi:hypothetical protein